MLVNTQKTSFTGADLRKYRAYRRRCTGLASAGLCRSRRPAVAKEAISGTFMRTTENCRPDTRRKHSDRVCHLVRGACGSSVPLTWRRRARIAAGQTWRAAGRSALAARWACAAATKEVLKYA